jgi:hypothetical protein
MLVTHYIKCPISTFFRSQLFNVSFLLLLSHYILEIHNQIPLSLISWLGQTTGFLINQRVGMRLHAVSTRERFLMSTRLRSGKRLQDVCNNQPFLAGNDLQAVGCRFQNEWQGFSCRLQNDSCQRSFPSRFGGDSASAPGRLANLLGVDFKTQTFLRSGNVCNTVAVRRFQGDSPSRLENVLVHPWCM